MSNNDHINSALLKTRVKKIYLIIKDEKEPQ